MNLRKLRLPRYKVAVASGGILPNEEVDSGSGGALSISYFEGLSNDGNEDWVSHQPIAGQMPNASTSFPLNLLHALPVILGGARTLKKFRFFHAANGAANSELRIGLYDTSTTPSMWYPSTLKAEVSFDTSTGGGGYREASVNVPLVRGLYWIASLFRVASPTIAYGFSYDVPAVLSHGNDPIFGYGSASAYTALPSIYTPGATKLNAASYNVPLVWLRLDL